MGGEGTRQRKDPTSSIGHRGVFRAAELWPPARVSQPWWSREGISLRRSRSWRRALVGEWVLGVTYGRTGSTGSTVVTASTLRERRHPLAMPTGRRGGPQPPWAGDAQPCPNQTLTAGPEGPGRPLSPGSPRGPCGRDKTSFRHQESHFTPPWTSSHPRAPLLLPIATFPGG